MPLQAGRYVSVTGPVADGSPYNSPPQEAHPLVSGPSHSQLLERPLRHQVSDSGGDGRFVFVAIFSVLFPSPSPSTAVAGARVSPHAAGSVSSTNIQPLGVGSHFCASVVLLGAVSPGTYFLSCFPCISEVVSVRPGHLWNPVSLLPSQRPRLVLVHVSRVNESGYRTPFVFTVARCIACRSPPRLLLLLLLRKRVVWKMSYAVPPGTSFAYLQAALEVLQEWECPSFGHRYASGAGISPVWVVENPQSEGCPICGAQNWCSCSSGMRRS